MLQNYPWFHVAFFLALNECMHPRSLVRLSSYCNAHLFSSEQNVWKGVDTRKLILHPEQKLEFSIDLLPRPRIVKQLLPFIAQLIGEMTLLCVLENPLCPLLSCHLICELNIYAALARKNSKEAFFLHITFFKSTWFSLPRSQSVTCGPLATPTREHLIYLSFSPVFLLMKWSSKPARISAIPVLYLAHHCFASSPPSIPQQMPLTIFSCFLPDFKGNPGEAHATGLKGLQARQLKSVD